MKKINIVLMLVLMSTMVMAQTSVWHGGRSVWTHGSGTEGDPFLIESADNLAYLSYVVGKGFDTSGLHFLLTTDIDLNGSEDQPWVPIGLGDRYFSEDGCDRGKIITVGTPTFHGHFDGGEHSISNIYVDSEDGNCGLFGCAYGVNVDSMAVIENVFVTNGFIKGSDCGGILGKCLRFVLVSRCWNGATIEGGDVGGIVGKGHNSAKVYNCYNTGNLSGSNVGGIAGNSAKEIIECYNEGNITASSFGGGIVGGNVGRAVIDNCYNTASVSAIGELGNIYSAAGGLLGCGIFDSITNCYSIGEVSGNNYYGCLIGNNRSNIFVGNSYYLNTCTESEFGDSKSEEYMRSQEFVDYLNGGSRTPVWSMDEENVNDGFPILAKNNLAVEESSAPAFNVYPNPAQGQFVVEGVGKMVVSNLLGQIILIREIDGQTTVALPSGMYFVKLGNETQKVVVK